MSDALAHVTFLTMWAADIRASSGVSVDADNLESAAQALAALEAENERLRKALENMLKRYVDLAGSGDCGFWNPEDEDEVIASRAALEAAR